MCTQLFSYTDTNSHYKVSVVSGDCTLPGLGLSDEDRMTLAHKVDVVFHAAATVRFNEPLSQAITINVQGTKSMLDLARQMTKLKVSHPSFMFIIKNTKLFMIHHSIEV